MRRLFLFLLVLGAGSFFIWKWNEKEKIKETRFDHLIEPIARQEGVDPLLIRALIWRESRFNPHVLGLAQERGLMQVTPVAAEVWAKARKIDNWETDRLYDPATNIAAGTWYLARSIRRWKEVDDPITFALAEYNAGRTNALRWVDSGRPGSAVAFMKRIDFPSTHAYVETILKKYRDYQKGRYSAPWQVVWEKFLRLVD